MHVQRDAAATTTGSVAPKHIATVDTDDAICMRQLEVRQVRLSDEGDCSTGTLKVSRMPNLGKKMRNFTCAKFKNDRLIHDTTCAKS